MQNPYNPPSARIEEGGAYRTKTRIKRLSPHQNGKVFGVLMTIPSLIIFFPIFIIGSLAAPDVQGGMLIGMFFGMMLIIPIMYLIIGYITAVIGCWFYNLAAKLTGGIEFESQSFEP
jgi:hypothetical protein